MFIYITYANIYYIYKHILHICIIIIRVYNMPHVGWKGSGREGHDWQRDSTHTHTRTHIHGVEKQDWQRQPAQHRGDIEHLAPRTLCSQRTWRMASSRRLGVHSCTHTHVHTHTHAHSYQLHTYAYTHTQRTLHTARTQECTAQQGYQRKVIIINANLFLKES